MSHAASPYPDGIGDDDSAPPRGLIHRHASVLSLLLLGGFLATAFTGMLGGADGKPLRLNATDARLEVRTRPILRNGEFFETNLSATAERPIADLVIGLSPALWRDVTINTTIPAPTEEAYEDGLFKLHYGPLAAGDNVEIKIDGQINPPLFAGAKGDIVLFDGERELVRAPISIRVLP